MAKKDDRTIEQIAEDMILEYGKNAGPRSLRRADAAVRRETAQKWERVASEIDRIERGVSADD